MADEIPPPDYSPKIIKVLLAINITLFFFEFFSNYFLRVPYLLKYLGLDANKVLGSGQIWRVATYMFVHDFHPPFFHILFNMLTLWIFGRPLLEVWSERKFLFFYLSAGLFAGICGLIFYAVIDNNAIIIGASGCLFGLLYAFAKLFPTREIFFIQARFAIIIIMAIEILWTLAQDQIAHICHVGGAVFAFLYFRLEGRGEELYDRWKNRKQIRAQKIKRKREVEVSEAMVDIDPILKKISQHGIQSLSKDEKEKLEKASELKRKAKSKIISLDEYRKRQ